MTDFLVCVGEEIGLPDQHVLRVGKTLLSGDQDLEDYFGGELTSLESDLVRIASAVFAADRAVVRGDGEDLARSLRIQIPIVNIGRLQPLRLQIEDVLYRLSQDAWTLEFDQMSGTTEPKKARGEAKGKTLLFSGGADSLAAAVEFGGAQLQLISHRTMNQSTIVSQANLVAYLAKNGRPMQHVQVLVSSRSDPKDDFDHAAEDSQRTRSFVFLVLGAIAARRKGMHEIIFLAENGQMAIHLPLTQGRIGALSTHTAHPEVLLGMEQILSQALGVALSITNPFVYETKGEVVARIVSRLKPALWLSNSCWRSARLSKSMHCGECIPCFIRRIAIENHCDDETKYARDPWREDIAGMGPNDSARRNVVDLTEFIVRFRTMQNDDIISEWPELLSPSLNGDRVIEMYRRFSDEATAVLGRYPSMRPFLT